jgi:hypothetical protein
MISRRAACGLLLGIGACGWWCVLVLAVSCLVRGAGQLPPQNLNKTYQNALPLYRCSTMPNARFDALLIVVQIRSGSPKQN